MPYLSNASTDIQDMLKTIGVRSFDDLISNIPQNIRLKDEIQIPEAASELEIQRLMQELAGKNQTGVSFLGGGVYDHYIPAVVNELAARPEFYTSYTPYQPEVSQGNLQTMYEFQSMVCELTGMDVTNASMYEAGSALAEAVLLALNHTRKHKILLPATLNPNYRQVVETYLANMNVDIEEIPAENLTLNLSALKKQWTDEVAAVVVQHPNYYGFFENMDEISAHKTDTKALLIHVYDPISLGILQPPAAWQADLAIAEGQSLGNAQNYGGPFLGLFSSSQKLVRKIPGRLSGITKDVNGKRGFVLTLQTREQHIRREKATSNICTNSGLVAARAAFYLATVGKEGIKEIANLCLQKAHYLAEELIRIPGVEIASAAPFFKEFTIRLPITARKIISEGLKHNLFAGINLEQSGLENHLLVAVTEKRSRADLDLFIAFMKEVLS